MGTGKYTLAARTLHWVSAAVILWAMLSGFFMAALAADNILRDSISWLNISLTTVFTPVFMLRAVVAWRTPAPTSVAVPRWQQLSARVGHLLLYMTTAVVLFSGIMMMEGDISVFGFAVLPNPLSDPIWNGIFHAVHRHACMLLFLLLVVHIGAVVSHQRAGRNVLARMI